MHFSFTDGRELDIPDMCACCHISTGGRHESHCPLFQQQMREGYREMAEMNIKMAEAFLPIAKETYPEF